MQTWLPGSCFPISLLFTFIASLKILLITRRPPTLSIPEADFLDLCEQKVHSIKACANGGILLNKRQCLDLSAKLSKAVQNIRELVSHCGASSSTVFRPALENLYRILEKAKSLVSDCCHEDWCASSIYQSQNERAFQEILLDVGLCYKAIYEQAEVTSEEWNFELEDLRGSFTFLPASATDIDEDHQTLQKRLLELVRQPNTTGLSVLGCLLPRKLCLKQHLAQYLLDKLNSISQGKVEEKRKSCAILWNGAAEPSGTWGDQRFLGRGAGASGVMSTKWLGIPCAKKVFSGRIDGNLFSKEAEILADLNHPRVVKFFCCGTSEDEKEDRFIAMELMEMSLDYLIQKRKEDKRLFPLPVAIDIIMQIARGMYYLHDVGVAHRDLKPLNVVVNRLTYSHLDHEYFCVKLVDFGMSKTKVEVHKANTISYRGVGTTFYRAPEVHPKAHLDGEKLKAMWFKADVYSFAVTCAQILTLQQPYENIPNNSMYEELINGRRPVLNDCPPDLVLLLNACWHKIPSERPPFKAICSELEEFSHKFIRMKMGEPFPVQSQFVARTDIGNEVEEIQTVQDLGTSSSTPASSGGCSASDSKEVEPFSGDAHQALAISPPGKLAKDSLSKGKSSAAPKSRRKSKDKTGTEKKTATEKTGTEKKTATEKKTGTDKIGTEKPQTREAKKMMTPEIAIAHGNGNGNGELRKASKGKKLDLETPVKSEPPVKVNSGKMSKRKQALDDSPIDTTPLGKARNDVPATEKKKRRRKDADKKLGEGPKLMEGANFPALVSSTFSLDRVAFEPVYHFWNGDDEEEITVVYRRPAVPAVKKSRVRCRKKAGMGRSI